MSGRALVRHDITHKVQARNDHPHGDGATRWFASLDGGESYVGPVESEPSDGDYVELRSNTLPVSLTYPRGFRLCGLTLTGEPIPLAARPTEQADQGER